MTSHTLSLHGFNLTVNTRFGLIERFAKGALEILHPAKIGPPNPLTSAAYPLFPFSGRIANANFEFRGKVIDLPRNFPPEPHAIHGFSWEADWSIIKASEDRLHLQHDYEARDWPWTYRADQIFKLTPAGLTLDLTLTNLSDHPMPGGFGWHPFFPSNGAAITADVFGFWPSDKGGIPNAPTALPATYDLRTTKNVEGLDLDHCFQAGPQGATISYPNHSVRIDYSEVFTQFIVYNPSGETFFCAEPISHAPDAANSALPHEITGWQVIEPDQSIGGTIWLSVEDT